MRALSPLIAVLASTLLLSGTVRAQTPAPTDIDTPPAPSASPKEENVQRHLDFLTKRLGLTSDQQTRITPLLRQEADEAAPVYSQPDPAAQTREIFRIRKQAVERISPILTPAQRETLMKTIRGKYLD